VAGPVGAVVIEVSDRPEKIDHVWINVLAGAAGTLSIALSTCSRQSRAAGFDPRIWVGTVASTWSELPAAGIHRADPFNYADIEAKYPVRYVPYDRPELEELLLQRARRAVCAEAWGELYVRGHGGLHQIHSRRSSFAVPEDLIGQDGALRLYYREATLAEMLLLKFAGQP